MALTQVKTVDKIEVVGQHKQVQVRLATKVFDNGVLISKGFHRHIINPTDDTSNETAEIQAICSAVHTQAVKDSYQALLDAERE